MENKTPEKKIAFVGKQTPACGPWDAQGKEDEIDVSTHGEPNKVIPVVFNPRNHVAVVCARKGINLGDVGRNEPCPCGSGKKFKKCCIDQAPEELCLRFARADRDFHITNLNGDFEHARKLAKQHNELLSVLRLLDPTTFKQFEPLEVAE